MSGPLTETQPCIALGVMTVRQDDVPNRQLMTGKLRCAHPIRASRR